MSLKLTWMMTQITVDGSKTQLLWQFLEDDGDNGTGETVLVLKNLTLWMMESPRIVVVGGKSVQGDSVED